MEFVHAQLRELLGACQQVRFEITDHIVITDARQLQTRLRRAIARTNDQSDRFSERDEETDPCRKKIAAEADVEAAGKVSRAKERRATRVNDRSAVGVS